MATTYTVTKRSTCPTCSGEKWVQPKIWKQYWRENNNRCLDDPEHEAWFSKNGYPPHEIPSDLIQCEDCEGVGSIEQSISLADALRELGIQEKPAARQES